MLLSNFRPKLEMLHMLRKILSVHFASVFLLTMQASAEGLERFGTALLRGEKERSVWTMVSNSSGTVLENNMVEPRTCRFFSDNSLIENGFHAKPVTSLCPEGQAGFNFNLARSGRGAVLSFPDGEFLPVRLAPSQVDFSSSLPKEPSLFGVPWRTNYESLRSKFPNANLTETRTLFSQVPGSILLTGKNHQKFDLVLDTVIVSWSDQSFAYRIKYHFLVGLRDIGSRLPIAAFADIRPIPKNSSVSVEDAHNWLLQQFGKHSRSGIAQPYGWKFLDSGKVVRGSCSRSYATVPYEYTEIAGFEDFPTQSLMMTEERKLFGTSPCVGVTANIIAEKGRPVGKIQIAIGDPLRLSAYALAYQAQVALGALAFGRQPVLPSSNQPSSETSSSQAEPQESQETEVVEENPASYTLAADSPGKTQRLLQHDLSEKAFGITRFRDEEQTAQAVFSPYGNFVHPAGSQCSYMFKQELVDGLFFGKHPTRKCAPLWFGLAQKDNGDLILSFPGEEYEASTLSPGKELIAEYWAPELKIGKLSTHGSYSQALQKLNEAGVSETYGFIGGGTSASTPFKLRNLSSQWEGGGFDYTQGAVFTEEQSLAELRPALGIFFLVRPKQAAGRPYRKDIIAWLENHLGKPTHSNDKNWFEWGYSWDGLIETTDANTEDRCKPAGGLKTIRVKNLNLSGEGADVVGLANLSILGQVGGTEEVDTCRYIIHASISVDYLDRVSLLRITYSDPYSLGVLSSVLEIENYLKKWKKLDVPSRSPFAKSSAVLPQMD